MSLKCKNTKLKYCKGSFTIEATLLIIFSIILISMILYCGIYFYGKFYFSSSSLFLARRGMELYLNDFDLEESSINWNRWSNKGVLYKLTYDFSDDEALVKKYIEKDILAPVYLEDASVRMDSNQINVTYHSKVKVPFNNMIKIGKEGVCFEGKIKVDFVDNEEIIRMYRGILYPLLNQTSSN